MLGRRLTAKLATQGHEIIILSRSPERVTGLPQQARAVGWDTETAAGWGELVNGQTVIVNLAGENIGEGGRWTDERKQRIISSRVTAGEAVMAAVVQAEEKPQAVIQASAVGYYGNRGDEMLPETAAPGDDFLASVCIAWENAIQGVGSMTRLAIMRIGVVLTTQGGALPKMLIPFKLFAGGPYGNGEQWFPWIHIDDVIGAIEFLITAEDATGPFNLAAPNIMKNKQFAKTLGSVMGRPAFVPTPAAALKVALGEMSVLLLDGQRAQADKLQQAGYTFKFPDAEAALQDILKRDV